MQEKVLRGRKSQQCRRLFIERRGQVWNGKPPGQLSREGHPVLVLSGVGGAKEDHPTALCPLWRQASYMWALA